MFKFKTANSIYEVDESNHCFRRVSGVNPPTESINSDGEWHPYEAAMIEVGHPALISYGNDKGLITSPVTEIDNMPESRRQGGCLQSSF